LTERFSLAGKVALVTGGSGGIGKALAFGLAENGADVIIASRGLAKLQDVEKDIKNKRRNALAVSVDITDQKSVNDMLVNIQQKFSHIDILVNAAGLAIRKPADSFPIDEWQRVMDANIRGTWLCCQAVGRVMITQKSGKIINVSSVSGRYGLPSGYAAYCPSKGAVDTLTRTLACEWAKHNITVNAIAPTVVETELTKELLADVEYAKTLKARIPMGRWATTEDIVGPCIFFASDAANFVTGQILYIDGGVTTW